LGFFGLAGLKWRAWECNILSLLDSLPVQKKRQYCTMTKNNEMRLANNKPVSN